MKFWIAFVALFLVTAISQAQVPVYGPYQYSQPYYPGAVTEPYYPQAYYPQLYGQPYSQDLYNAETASRNAEVDSLTRQVQQLTDEVRMLQSQLSDALAQQQNQTRVSENPTVKEPSQPVVLILKDGKRYEALGYAVAGDMLWILTPFGSSRIAISSLNIRATQRENLKRGIQFPDLVD
jgi:hypothetical protein